MTAGTMDSTLAAASTCVEVCWIVPWKLKMPTAIGRSRGLLIRMNGTMNCDQPRMALSTNAEVTPGRLSGRITRMKAPKRVQPSIMAASSRLCGMPSRKPLSIQVNSGAEIAM